MEFCSPDLDIYYIKEELDVRNVKSVTGSDIYDLKLVKKTRVSPTAYIFVFEYTKDLKNIFEVGLFTHFLFIGEHDEPVKDGYWNGTLLESNNREVSRKYTPIYINVSSMQLHFLIRVYDKTDEYPDGGKFSRYLDGIELNEYVNVASSQSRFRFIEDNTIRITGVNIKFDVLNIIAGGTGITPFIRLLLYYRDSNVSVNLLYCNRSVEEIMLKEWFDKLASGNKNIAVKYLACKVDGEHSDVIPSRVNESIILENFPNTDNSLCLYCGPPPMRDSVSEILDKLGYKHVYKV